MAQDRDIKYVNRDFTDFKTQLTEYAKNYFPDAYNDFSPTSPGMMFIEMAAYVGDILSFYQDTQLQETYIQYAKNPANLYNLAYMMGYRPKVTSVSEVDIQVSCTVPPIAAPSPNVGEPNWAVAPQLAAGTQLGSTTAAQTRFIIDHPVDFAFSSSYNPTAVAISQLDPITFVPTEFILTKTAKAYSGEIKQVTETVGAVEKFKTITIDDTDIIGIVSITDGENNIWYEVPFLGQDTIFKDVPNAGTADSTLVPYLLTLEKVPRRFVTRFTSTGQLQVQFGSGITGTTDTILTPDPTNIGLGLTPFNINIDYAYDPSNFLHTQTYGLAPSNTTLTIRYTVGGGVSANVPSNTITTVVSKTPVGDTSRQNTVVFNNPQAATGGRDGDTIEELRENALKSFNEQGRTVTLQDYIVRSLSLPAKYGTIAKVYVAQDQLSNPNSKTDTIIDSNPLSLSIYTLAYDNNGNFIQATPNLHNNLKTYLSQYIMLTDAINLKDAFVVNIGVNFDIIVRPNYSGRDVLLSCTNMLKDYFSNSKWNINQPINLSSIYTLLDQEKGVQTVQKVEIVNNAGGNYSQYAYDIKGATKSNIVYPSYDPMIFEVKYLDTDIKGRITTL